MSRLPRPYIPLATRVEVAERQADALGFRPDQDGKLADQLEACLAFMFGAEKAHLDHDPPLAARKRIRNHYTGEIRFEPDANDPRYLVWRSKEDHRVKTFVRGEHGQYSDVALIKRERRRHRKRKPKQKIQNRKDFRWPSRPFSKRK